MRAALVLAERGLGRTAPNPAVGCILVKDGCVLGRGWTQPGGRPHAETEALRRAEENSPGSVRGATCYVTLEPCAHHGKTPPCADALVSAGIARCVTALEDPDPRVSGQGLQRLRAQGCDLLLVLGASATTDRRDVIPAGIEAAGGRPFMTYLALLFMAHRGSVRLQQDDLFGDLWVKDPSAMTGESEAIAD